MRSCVFPLGAVEKDVTTVEGLGSPERPHQLQEAFISEQAVQCGYCINGMIMTAAALLKKVPKPTESQIREALDNNLCRCGTHMRIIKAVKRAAGGVK
jgi:nicotinate dehydrogenase subunit A